MSPAKRHADGEGGTRFGLAVDPNVAVVQLDELLNQGKPDAAALVCPAFLTLNAVEALEQTWQFLLGNTDVGVLDQQRR